jgi:hypothetical protein
MAQKFVTKKTVIKNTTGRAPAINYLSEKLTALSILVVLIVLIYWFWPSNTTSSEFVITYNEQLNNGDFSGASLTIEEAKNSGADTSFLGEGEEQRLDDVNRIINKYPE